MQTLVAERIQVSENVATCMSLYGEVMLEDLIFTVGEMSVRLKPKGAKLLRLLMEAKGMTVPYSQLLRGIGYHPEAKTHTVEMHFYRIRNILKVLGVSDFIQSVPASGYGLSIERGYRVNVTPLE